MKTCPNCNKKLEGLMVSRYIMDNKVTDFLNRFNENTSEAYCNGCGGELVEKYRNQIIEQKKNLTQSINKLIVNIPILTAHQPISWDYEILEIVTSQSITGTGMFSEIASSWTDFLGGQSETLTNKLKQGELFCKNQLRYQAALLGGNAIIATDVDYSEVGGGKGMLMVCMAGTAVRIKNMDSVFKEKIEDVEQLRQLVNNFKELDLIYVPNI